MSAGNPRIAACFARLRQQGRKALIPYLTSGHPLKESTVPLMRAVVDAGADIIELGVPFSDPMADGPTIQRSNEIALSHKTNMRDVLAMVQAFRQHDTHTPIVLMGYQNPIERFGVEAWVQAAVAAGIDGLITVDAPPEESGAFVQQLRAALIDPIFLLAPTSTAARIALVAKQVSGYLYYVSMAGTTGAADADAGVVLERVGELRAHISVPIGVGFGIKDGRTAAAIAQGADAVVIGSRLIQIIDAAGPVGAPAAAAAFIADVRQAMDRQQSA